jgi:hypothetical protein
MCRRCDIALRAPAQERLTFPTRGRGISRASQRNNSCSIAALLQQDIMPEATSQHLTAHHNEIYHNSQQREICLGDAPSGFVNTVAGSSVTTCSSSSLSACEVRSSSSSTSQQSTAAADAECSDTTSGRELVEVEVVCGCGLLVPCPCCGSGGECGCDDDASDVYDDAATSDDDSIQGGCGVPARRRRCTGQQHEAPHHACAESTAVAASLRTTSGRDLVVEDALDKERAKHFVPDARRQRRSDMRRHVMRARVRANEAARTEKQKSMLGGARGVSSRLLADTHTSRQGETWAVRGKYDASKYDNSTAAASASRSKVPLRRFVPETLPEPYRRYIGNCHSRSHLG